MPAGRPRIVDPHELYFFAQEFYWDFRGLAEGKIRWGFDKHKFNRTIAASEKKPLNKQERTMLMNQAEEEVRAGHLHESQKQDWLREKESDYLWMQRHDERSVAVKEARSRLRVPGEPDVLEALLDAETPQQIREICKDAFAYINVQFGEVSRDVEVANWPIPSGNGSMFPRYLSQYAEQFITAKKDTKFPASGRPTSQLKQLWFLSRALAGAVLGVQTRTAVNLVGSKRPEQIFAESRAAKWERVQTKRKRRS